MVQHFPVETSHKFIYYRLYCFEAESRCRGLSYMQLLIYSDWANNAWVYSTLYIQAKSAVSRYLI